MAIQVVVSDEAWPSYPSLRAVSHVYITTTVYTFSARPESKGVHSVLAIQEGSDYILWHGLDTI